MSLLGGIIGGVGSLIAGKMGADATQDAADTQYEINERNLEFQREQQAYDQALQQYLMQLQLQDRTDAYGNRTYYDPVTGWQTDLAPDVQANQDAALKEAILRNTVDANQSRTERGTNFDRRQDESQVAKGLLQEFINQKKMDPHQLEQLLIARGEGQRQAETDRQMKGIMTQHLRSGGSSSAAAQLLGQAQAQNAAGRADTGVEAALKALTVPDELYNANRNAIGNQYNMFASRAANIYDAPYMPDNISGGIQQGSGGAAGQAAIGMRQQAPQMAHNYQADLLGNYGPALFAGGAANTLQNFFQQQAFQDSLNPQRQTYAGSSGFGGTGNQQNFGPYGAFSSPNVQDPVAQGRVF